MDIRDAARDANNGSRCKSSSGRSTSDLKVPHDILHARASSAQDNHGESNASDLDMLQLSDSMFPTGMFASSGGLELMFTQKMISTRQDLLQLCAAIMENQIGPSDCVALACSYDAAISSDTAAIGEVDALCCSMKTVQEAREASVRSGIQLCRCVSEFCAEPCLMQYVRYIDDERASGVYPVALGVCCSALHIAKKRALTMLLYGFAAGMTSAALRLGMIQHFEAQKTIHELKPVARSVASRYAECDMSEMWQFCPHAEILQMAHQRMDSKMFIT